MIRVIHPVAVGSESSCLLRSRQVLMHSGATKYGDKAARRGSVRCGEIAGGQGVDHLGGQLDEFDEFRPRARRRLGTVIVGHLPTVPRTNRHVQQIRP